MILHTQPSDPWDEYDFLLLEAFQIMQDERCGQCGLPRWICHDDTGDVQFDLVEDTCFAKVELDARDEKNQNKKKYKAPKGTVVRPEPYAYSKKPFDFEMRGAYYERQAALAT